MMSNVKRILVKIALAVLFVAMIGMVVSNVSFKTQASSDPVFNLDGAWIKEVDDELADKTAMRFTTTFNQAFVDSLGENAEITFNVTANDVAQTRDLLALAGSSIDGNFEYNADFANIPVEGWQTYFYIDVIASGDALSEPILLSSARNLEYVAANAVIEGAEGLSEYIGGGVGYDDPASTAWAVEGYDFNPDPNSEIAIPGLDSAEAATAIYINGEDALNYGYAVPGDNGGVLVTPDFTVLVEKHVENTMVVLSDGNAYRTNFKVTDFALTTADDVNNYFNVYARSINKNDTSGRRAGDGEYVLLTNNIVATDFYTFTRGADVDHGYVFGMTLDGQGYTLTLKNNSNAVFWGLGYSVIENIGLVVDRTKGAGTGAVLCWNSGTGNAIRNCYIEGVSSQAYGATAAGLANDFTSSSIDNTIINLEQNSTGAGEFNIIANGGNRAQLNNVYFVSTTYSGFDQRVGVLANNNYGKYQTLSDASAAIIANETSLKAFQDSGLWTIENGAVYFTSAFENVQLGGVEFEKNYSDALVYDLAAVGIDGVTDVQVEGASVAYTIEDGVLTLAEAVLGTSYRYYGSSARGFSTAADQIVTIVTADATYELPVMVIDYAVYTTNDFYKFVSYVYAHAKTTTSADDNPNQHNTITDGYYSAGLRRSFVQVVVELKANIDLGTHGSTYGAYDWYSFGTPDFFLEGNGYTIHNLYTRSGLFNNVGAFTMKNVAWTNIHFKDTTTSAFIFGSANYARFVAESCYFEIDYTTAAANLSKYGFSNGANNESIFRACVFNVKVQDAMTNIQSNHTNASKAFALGNNLIVTNSANVTAVHACATASASKAQNKYNSFFTYETLLDGLNSEARNNTDYTIYNTAGADYLLDIYADAGIKESSNWTYSYDVDGAITNIQWTTAAKPVIVTEAAA